MITMNRAQIERALQRERRTLPRQKLLRQLWKMNRASRRNSTKRAPNPPERV